MHHIFLERNSPDDAVPTQGVNSWIGLHHISLPHDFCLVHIGAPKTYAIPEREYLVFQNSRLWRVDCVGWGEGCVRTFLCLLPFFFLLGLITLLFYAMT